MADWANYLVFDILGDLCYAHSFDIKEPGPNELKFIPEFICDYLKFEYPVSGILKVHLPPLADILGAKSFSMSSLPSPHGHLSGSGSNLAG